VRRDDFLARLRHDLRVEVPDPELPALRSERGAALRDRFAEAAIAAGAHVHPWPLNMDMHVQRPSKALFGLADTGSVVLAASPDEPRGASLLPPVWVAELRVADILPGLPELFAEVGTELPSSLAIVTGPSRSADIEQILTLGVHGPGEVHVVLVD
jgi:L-lactate dehydrogenase complex protein LldG